MPTPENAQKSLYKSQLGEDRVSVHLHPDSSPKSPYMELTTPHLHNLICISFPCIFPSTWHRLTPSKVQDIKEIWDTDYKCHLCQTFFFFEKKLLFYRLLPFFYPSNTVVFFIMLWRCLHTKLTHPCSCGCTVSSVLSLDLFKPDNGPFDHRVSSSVRHNIEVSAHHWSLFSLKIFSHNMRSAV